MSKSVLVFSVTIAFVTMLIGSEGAPASSLPIHQGTRILKSGNLVVEVGDPDSPECRWNRGLRFSPVANVLCAQLKGQEFLYAPADGGAVGSGYQGGLAMEFDIGQEQFQPDPPGYNEATSGDPFLKIGVGILQRDGSPYSFFANYPVIELAETTVTWQSDRARFVQTLSGNANGYSYGLEEDVIVKNDRIILQYKLRNTGSRAFTTEQYIHNFLAFSNRPVGPNYRVSFPYDFTSTPAIAPLSPPDGIRRLRVMAADPQVARLANMILYLTRVSSVPKIWVHKPQIYQGGESFAVEHTDTAQRLIIQTSLPAEYVGIWTTDYQVSPEQFVQITLAPGEHIEFTRTYIFSVDGFVRHDCTGDGVIDVSDLSVMSSAWLSEPAADAWEPSCDVSDPADDKIDLRDLAAMASAWRQDVEHPTPVAHWKLNETSGTTASDGAGGYHGALQNFPSDDSQWVTGIMDGGLNFDGIDDYVEADGFYGVTGKDVRSVSAWVQTAERFAVRMAILAWGEPSPGRYWLLEVDSSRMLRLSCDTGFVVAAEPMVSDSRWHHVAAVLNPIEKDKPRVSDIELYVDGRRRGIVQLVEHDIDTASTATVRLGASHHPESSPCFNGIIDDVRIFDTKLSAAYIQQLFIQAGGG